ncbi:hypothetical protein X975_11166, partial [Stegodyphus mimosarum]
VGGLGTARCVLLTHLNSSQTHWTHQHLEHLLISVDIRNYSGKIWILYFTSIMNLCGKEQNLSNFLLF